MTELRDHFEDGGGSDTFAGFLTGEPITDRRSLEILLRTISEVNSSIDLDDLLVSVVDKALGFTQAERGILMLYDGKDDGELKVRVARDSFHRDLPPDTLYSRSIPHKVAQDGEPVCLIDAASADGASLGQSIVDLRLLSVMCVPLVVKERTIGVLYVDNRAGKQEFTESHLALFNALCYQMAIAIENTRLLSETMEKQRMEHSLSLARDIQQSLLPPGGLSLPGFDLYGLSRPCDETGGDYFDYIRVEKDRMGLVVGDVSGHGVSAALFMATARALLRAFVSTKPDLAGVFYDLNNSLERDMGTGSFMTLFYGDLDVKRRVLRYVRAGHNEPLLYRAETDEFEELKAPGTALGFVRGYEYQVAGPVEFRSGDILVMYTDGIPEARRADGGKEQFGMERVCEIVRSKRTRTAEEIVESVVHEVAEFTGTDQFEDDLTLIVAKATDEEPPLDRYAG